VHQALSDRLQTRQITPADIAIPPGPGGRYRKGYNTIIVLQQSPDHPLLYDNPHEALLSTYIEQNMACMHTNSSPGFDPFPTLFIKRAETELMDGQGKAQRAMCSSHCSQIFSDSSYVMVCFLWPGKKQNHTLSTRKLSLLFHRTTGL